MLPSKQDRVGASMVFYNTIEKCMQKGDPRPDDIELPSGWTKEYDDEGDVYFHDHNGNISSYDDPRTCAKPVAAKGLEPKIKRRSTQRASKKVSKKTWVIQPRDLDGFKATSNYLTMPDEIPAPVRNKKYNRFM